MAFLINEGVSPADLTIADDWCVKIPDGYKYSTYQDDDENKLLTIHTDDDTENWCIKLSKSKVEGVADLLSYDVRTRIELLVLETKLIGNKNREFIMRHESDMCIFCQLYDCLKKGSKMQSAVYLIQLITLKALYEFEVCFNSPGTQDKYQEILNRIVNSICLAKDKVAPAFTRKFMSLNKMLPVTEPQDLSIMKMYRQVRVNQFGYANLMRLGMVMNDSVEYSLRALTNIETEGYSISEKAWDIAEVFRVSEKHFDPCADREVEIQHCFIREIDHMQTFRTFAWLIGEYCKQKDCGTDGINKDTVLALGQLAGSRRISYDENHYPAICGFPDVYTVYIPDGESCSDIDRLPGIIKENSSDEWRIADLNELRRELEDLYPCMQIFDKYLRKSRKNKDMPLRGDQSDILYVWCSLTIAANFAFAVTPDAPMNYCYSDKMSYQEFVDNNYMPKFEDDESNDSDSSVHSPDDDFDWKEFFARRRQRYVDNCVIVDTIPSFSGKTFVASGIEKKEVIKSFLNDKGAFLRGAISGKTDYLIVLPEQGGNSKYEAVLEQAEKGHTVEVIFYEDFEKYMDEDYQNDDADDYSLDDEAETALKKLSYSGQVKDEYKSENAEYTTDSETYTGQIHSIISQMQSGLSDMKVWAEQEQHRLEEEERKREELEKKKAEAQTNRNVSEESVLMYMTLIIEDANGQNRSDEDFYSCYEEDFPALDENGISQLRRRIKSEIQNDPQCYEDAARSLPYDKRYDYSAKNMCNTHIYSGDPNEDVESLIIDTVSRWFDTSELSDLRSGVEQLIEEERTNLEEFLDSVNEDWKRFYLAKNSLYIGILDASDVTFEPENKLMVKYDDYIGVVMLATSGLVRMSSKLTNYYPVYWKATLKDIWDAAKENGVYDRRENKDDRQEEHIAQVIYDRAMLNPEIKTSPSSYANSATDYSQSDNVQNLAKDQYMQSDRMNDQSGQPKPKNFIKKLFDKLFGRK